MYLHYFLYAIVSLGRPNLPFHVLHDLLEQPEPPHLCRNDGLALLLHSVHSLWIHYDSVKSLKSLIKVSCKRCTASSFPRRHHQ